MSKDRRAQKPPRPDANGEVGVTLDFIMRMFEWRKDETDGRFRRLEALVGVLLVGMFSVLGLVINFTLQF